MGLLDDMLIGAYLKAERQADKSFQDRIKLIDIMKNKRLSRLPICRCCKRKPEDISEYKDHDNPTMYVLERESIDSEGFFTCTQCYIRNGFKSF